MPNLHLKWDVSTSVQQSTLPLGPTSPITNNSNRGISLRAAFVGVGFFSIRHTKFGKVQRLNELRMRARRCFFCVFFIVAAQRLIRREGILQMRVCDVRFVDDTHAIHLPLGRRCECLPDQLTDEFESLALTRLRLIFQPILLRRLLRKSLAALMHQHYREVPTPTAEDLKLASPFFALFPEGALGELARHGTMRVYRRGMWVAIPRSARSAARSGVNRSAKSRLREMLPQLSASGVVPEVAPALFSAFIVLHGIVTDLSNNDCSIGECYGETASFAEGGVAGNGFRVYSMHALTWEIDFFAIASVITTLPPRAYDAVLAYIVERRVQIITRYFRPSISQVQAWPLFRTASAVDVTTHVLPRMVPKVYFCGTTIVMPESSESDRGVYVVARGRVTASGAAAVEDEDVEFASFGEYEGFFSEGFDLAYRASTIVDCWVLPRGVIQSIAKIPYLRPDMIVRGLQIREALLQRCGPSRGVIEHVLSIFLGKCLHSRIIDTVMRLLQPKVFPAGERVITAGEDERQCIFFVRGKLNQSSAHGFIPHAPPSLYGPSLLQDVFDPLKCHGVGPLLTSWKLSLVAVRNVECWTVPVSKLHAALKIFFETCDLPPAVLTATAYIPAAAVVVAEAVAVAAEALALAVAAEVQPEAHPPPAHRLRRCAVVIRTTMTTGHGSSRRIPPPPDAKKKKPTTDTHQHPQQHQQLQQRPRSSSTATLKRGPSMRKSAERRPSPVAVFSFGQSMRAASITQTKEHALRMSPREQRKQELLQNLGRDDVFDMAPTLRTDGRGDERVQEMRDECARDLRESLRGPTINPPKNVMPNPNAPRRMHDLNCLKVHAEAPDKRYLLFLRRLPQTPRVHGKVAGEFAETALSRRYHHSQQGRGASLAVSACGDHAATGDGGGRHLCRSRHAQRTALHPPKSGAAGAAGAGAGGVDGDGDGGAAAGAGGTTVIGGLVDKAAAAERDELEQHLMKSVGAASHEDVLQGVFNLTHQRSGKFEHSGVAGSGSGAGAGGGAQQLHRSSVAGASMRIERIVGKCTSTVKKITDRCDFQMKVLAEASRQMQPKKPKASSSRKRNSNGGDGGDGGDGEGGGDAHEDDAAHQAMLEEIERELFSEHGSVALGSK